MIARVRGTAVTALAACVLAGVAACASILGIDPVALDSTSDGASDALADVSANEAGLGEDAPGFDAGLEASNVDAPLPDAACLPCADAATNPCGIVCDAPPASEFLEVGNGFVFFGSRTRLERAAFDGSQRILIATGAIGGVAFHAPTATLAWTVPMTGEIHLRFVNGEPANEKIFTVPSNGQLRPTQIYLTATSVVYFESSDDPTLGGGQAYACDLAAATCAGSGRVLVFGGNAPEQPVAAAVGRLSSGGTPYVAWRTRSTTTDAGSVYAARESALDAGVPVKKNGLGTMEFMPVAADDVGNVYWTQVGPAGATHLVKASVDTPGTVNLVVDTGSDHVASIAVAPSANGLFFSEPGASPSSYDGKIIKVLGGTPMARYTKRPNPGRVVFDPGSSFVYWLDRGNPPQTPTLVMRGQL